MKIGLVCPYNIFKGGGVQEVVLALQKNLTELGHDVKIITPMPKLYKGEIQNFIITIGTSRDLKSPFHTTAQIAAVTDTVGLELMLEKEQFDVINFHEPWVPIISRQILAKSKAVHVGTFHAKLPENMMSKTIEKVVTPYTKSIIKQLDYLTAVSEAASDYVKTLTKSEIKIIPNGIDLQKYRKNARTNLSNKRTILFIGRLEKRKGVKYLLKAFQIISKHDKNVRLIIAGEGPERTKLETLVRDEKIPRVEFLGYVEESKKLELFEKSDLFCSPAIYGESFGIVLLEAMAKGTVTVAANNPGYVSVLNHTGTLSIVNPKDSLEFARRLSLMLYNRNIRELWLSWASKSIEKYDYKKIAKSYEEAFKKACKKSSK